MSPKAQENRQRIDKSKALTLDERIAIVRTAQDELNITPTAENSKKLANWLTNNGYEPMMFGHACKIIQSERK